ncbi:MAG: LPS export ABC transporter periplasmic protein LptC [Novosphingobium sp.]
MSEAARIVRSRRQQFAAPGGSHDRLVRFLAVALPGAVGVIAAVMILAPLSPRGEISFLLDRNKVAVTQQRLRVDSATYRGSDNRGRAFAVSAGTAVQASAAVPVVEMKNLLARMQLADGPAELSAPDGRYDFRAEQVHVNGPVRFSAADGYSLATSNVSIDLNARLVTGAGGVSGAIPAGTFSAERIVADLGERSVTLDGRARLRMVPGKLRMP